ncbi:hypothetical protein AM588_10005201 [Phytophthora nicotianae]|uniref:Uncharacterized protein n=1 Tax=Phytophthora nicotianae TaxID=4792 RepID=A0A0W8DFQ2_PHYNI|nr:hypothetical protein AM588_10005201 [Phytophthora nicotianae]
MDFAVNGVQLASGSDDRSVRIWDLRQQKCSYMVSSVGDKTSELKLYAVLSSDGSPPSCEFRELILARPFDACAPLSINVTERYVLVPVHALEHQWKELAGLAVPSNWPATEAARDRLFHRMLKDQATLDDHDMQLSLVKNERYEALVASYWSAQRYYSARTDDAAKTKLQGGDDSEDDR